MLTDAQRRRTSTELKTNLTLSGRTPQQISTDLGVTPEQLHATLDVDAGANPVDVWRLRDHLKAAAGQAGAEPVPYTVLTESARGAAQRWFTLRKT